MQVFAQAVPLQPKLPGQAVVIGLLVHAPEPLHWVSVTCIPPEHETTFVHDVPDVATTQAPEPAVQAPVFPQVPPAVQLTAQQTPLMPQRPLVHWSTAEQVPLPLASLGLQMPPAAQYAVEAHWLSLAQVVVQVPPEQRKGVQSWVGCEGAWHVMLLLQVSARVITVALMQTAAWQMVPGA